MRHRLRGRHLGRSPSHRLALFRNLSRALITHEKITTTVPKAKELRPFIEKLITLAKKAAIANDGSEAGKIKALHYRRLAIQKLGPVHGTGVYDRAGDPVSGEAATVLKKLFNVLGPRFVDRPGGYTRILKLHKRRLGDGGHTAIIEFLKEGEQKVQQRSSIPAPAPVLIPPTEPEPAPEEQPADEEPKAETPAEETTAPAEEPKAEAPATEEPAAESEAPAADEKPTEPEKKPEN